SCISFILLLPPPLISTLFPYTTLFRSALQKGAKSITQDLLIEGYIIGTPKRDHRFLRKKLKEKNIDVAPFEPYFNVLFFKFFAEDRKSTRLNSSHVSISYAVFCLKKNI